MTKQEAKKWAEIFQAIANGKEIEGLHNNIWEPYDHDMFVINIKMPEYYRIKPEPEYIPFDYKDFNSFNMKEVRRKGDIFNDETWIVVGNDLERVLILMEENLCEWKYFSSMFEEWEFKDGKPFGKIKKEL
jgi:hypothetical protein